MENMEKEKTAMSTLMSCTNMLTKLGFSAQFKAGPAGLKSLNTSRVYPPDEVKIVNFYRFEGESDPQENCILYAVETCNGEKGTIIDAYGPYSDTMITNFVNKIQDISKKVNKGETL